MIRSLFDGRRLVATALLFLMFAMFASPGFVRADVTIAKDGKAVAKIYVNGPLVAPEMSRGELNKLSSDDKTARKMIEVRGFAIEDLKYHIKKMSGAELEVVETDKPADVKGPAIVFGDLAIAMGAKAKDKTHTGDALRIIVKGDRILLGGEGDTAASHAMYHLLYTLGCDWLMPGEEGEIIPKMSTVVVKDMDVAKTPDWQVRNPWYSGGRRIVEADEFKAFDQWKRRQAQNHRHGDSGHPDFMWGGHMWASLLAHYKKEFDADPTMRPLVRQPDGTYERGKAQVEPLHPGVIDLTVKYIDGLFERNQWPNDAHVAISIGPNDGGGYSESPEAMAAGAGRIDPMTGDADQMDVLVKYANIVQERLDKKYPNLKVGFYIYSVHGDYPMKVRPNPKFVGHFADILYSRYHSIEDHSSYTRNYYRGILEQYARLHEEQGNPLWFYGYNWNLAENMLPYSKLRIWGEDLPYYHEMGVEGHNNEQDKAWSILGPHNYLMARMSWDMSLDWKEVLKEYCVKAFGEKAAPHMEAYYHHLVDRQHTAGHEAGGPMGSALVFNREWIKGAKQHLAKAAAAAKDPYHKKMVDYMGQSVFMLEYFHDYRDATFAFDFEKARANYEKMMAHWQKYMDMNPHLVSRYGHRYYDAWMFGPYTTQAKQYSTGDYKIIYKFPDELPTMFDPENMGALMGFYEPELKNEHQMTTRTYTSTWDAQGLGPYRDGGVWYRLNVPIDKSLAGKPVGLFIGSVEDTVHVWCNGEYIGMGRGYIRPFQFDLTDSIKAGEDNLIALQVERRSSLNEMGLGGMLFPSFVFTGPQLEKKAPAQQPMRRVLPGGAEGELIQ